MFNNKIIRFPARTINVGNRPIGGNHPIRIQSMTSTNTLDVKATVAQAIRIIEAGADYVRISVPSIEAAHRFKEIKAEIRAAGFTHPLIADIHFNPDVALVSAPFAEEIRINPGNYTRITSRSKPSFLPHETEAHLDLIAQRLQPLVRVCKDHGTAIRIGTNMGSLSARIVSLWGNTSQAMVESTFEFINAFRRLNFHDIIISVKASKPLIMIQAYEGMVEKMTENQMDYPLHIGITEAGEGENGRIKSALGICALLNKGIGDTIRVSLTEDPEFEIPIAKILADLYQEAFTQINADYSYSLKKLTVNEPKLSIFDDNVRAILIESFGDQILNPLKPSHKNINVIFKSQTESNTNSRADIIYYPDGNVDKVLLKEKFIMPVREWQKHQLQNGFPVYNSSEIAQIPNKRQKYFLDITESGLPAESTILVENKPLAIIADIDNPAIRQNWQLIESVCHKWECPLVIKKHFDERDSDQLICAFARIIGPMLIEARIHGLWIKAPFVGNELTSILFGFLQSSGLRITRTEFISCPTCARTSFDLQKVLKEIQEKTSSIPGLKLAVMGCVVNGPGEMADADFGYVGAGNGKIHLYKGKTPIKKNIDPAEAVNQLMVVLAENGFLKVNDPKN